MDNDLAIIYYTANVLPEPFGENVRRVLMEAIGGKSGDPNNPRLVCVSKEWMDFGDKNICVGDTPRSHVNIYRQAYTGALFAKTKYIAMAEDDVLYTEDHFDHRPSPGKFAYGTNFWGVYTWNNPPLYSWKGRRNLCMMICERELFIEAMKERFEKWPDDDKINIAIWAEPGKYERQLGVTVRETEEFTSQPPNIMFSHEKALAFDNLGKRKKVGDIRAIDIPYWGKVEDVIKKYI